MVPGLKASPTPSLPPKEGGSCRIIHWVVRQEPCALAGMPIILSMCDDALSVSFTETSARPQCFSKKFFLTLRFPASQIPVKNFSGSALPGFKVSVVLGFPGFGSPSGRGFPWFPFSQGSPRRPIHWVGRQGLALQRCPVSQWSSDPRPLRRSAVSLLPGHSVSPITPSPRGDNLSGVAAKGG